MVTTNVPKPPDRRRLGATAIEVSTLGMGCSRLGAFWQGRTPRDATAALKLALDAGINLFDTADCYARGLSERILGRAMRTVRDDVVLCTKVGLVKTPRAAAAALRARSATGFLARALFQSTTRAGEGARCFDPAYLRGATDRSLRRLGTDRIDVLFLHEPPLEVLRCREVITTLEQLVTSGRIRHFGVCTLEVDVAWASLEVPGLACLEVPFDCCRTEFAAEVIPEARDRGIGVLALAPLGDGRLVDDVPGLSRQDALSACLRAPLDVSGVTATLVGMSRPEHVVRNVDAIGIEPATDAVARVRQRHCPAVVSS